MADTATAHGSADGQGASKEQRERYQTETRQPHSYVGFVTQEEHVGKMRQLEERNRELFAASEARVRREVAAEYVPLMAAHDTAITELTALRAEVAAQRPVVAAVERLELVWDALSACVAEFEPQDMTACAEQRDHLDTAILAALALARTAPGSAPDAEQEGLPARGTPAWDAEYQAACDSRSWDMCELLQDQPWATPDARQGA